jgi:wobble nucleotide-excising tRNase
VLRRIDVKSSWRSLHKGFWPDDLPLGARTVVYGHNGSGKSTLSELLLAGAEGACPAPVVWENETGHRLNIDVGGSSPVVSIAVFTRKWVGTNLSAFLDGASASAIVTLGKEAIDAKGEELRLVDEIQRLRADASDTDKRRKAADLRVEKLAKEVQDRIVSELRQFDYSHFTKNRYSVPKVQDDLRKYKGEFPDSNAHAESLKRMGEGALSLIREIVSPPASLAARLADLEVLLAVTPSRVALQSLEGHAEAQSWVEDGLALHEGLDHCLFCSNEIGASRRGELARHFDKSWLKIRGDAKTLLTAVTAERQALVTWGADLAAPKEVASELQPVYEDAVQRVRTEIGERVAVLAAIESALEAKIADPSSTPGAPVWSSLGVPLSTTVLVQSTAEHNDQVRRHAEVTAERKQVVLDHLVGSQSAAFQDFEGQAKELAAKSERAKKAADLAERRLDEVRQEQFTTKEMADTLTRDLARVYGKDHLKVAVTADGKSYACRRGDEPGTDLSDGERTTLSLLYFLRKLEDEQIVGGDRSQRIVVIDDPSSSLDREALFATHQWLLDTLKGFGQYIILTHDFSLLSLFIKSHKNAWGSSMNKISKGDADEARFPKVSFLEMYAASVAGERQTRVGKLPRVLLTNTSEYAYLFSMVMAGISDSEEHERLFLLPNAARRVLEVFASYKAPHRTDFLQQLEALVATQEGEPYRDVYDFCNRFSHGVGSESVDVLDARAVHGQIRRCLEFLRAVDAEHFERMCSAIGADPAVIA